MIGLAIEQRREITTSSHPRTPDTQATPMPTFDHFGLLAPYYDRLIRPADVARLTDLAGLPTNGRLLDVGGGTGRVAQALARQAGSVTVADESWKMLSHTRDKPGLRPAAAHAERLPFPSGAFDRVVMVDAFHHLADQEQCLAELLRVCARAGRVVVEEPDITRPWVWAIAAFERLALMRSRFRRGETIARQLERLGALTSVHRQDATVWIVAQKATSS
jgi:demethylmenaquinone methyltransferase/2-methoxy-6-polyprenyl-1,4-benzoquinol methylase